MTAYPGFGFVDFEYHPHFTGDLAEYKHLAEYKRTRARDVYVCKDGAGLHVVDNQITTFGDVSKMKK